MDVKKVRFLRGRYRGMVLPRNADAADYLVRSGIAEHVEEERATQRATETPEQPRRARSKRTKRSGK